MTSNNWVDVCVYCGSTAPVFDPIEHKPECKGAK